MGEHYDGKYEFVVFTGFILVSILIISCILPYRPDNVCFIQEKLTDFIITLVSVVLGIWTGLKVNSISNKKNKKEDVNQLLIMYHDQLCEAIRTNDNTVVYIMAGQVPSITPNVQVFLSTIDRLYLVDDIELRASVKAAVFSLNLLQMRNDFIRGLIQNNDSTGFARHFPSLAETAIGATAYWKFKEDYDSLMNEHTMRRFTFAFTNEGVSGACIRALFHIEERLRGVKGWERFDPQRMEQVMTGVPVETWARLDD